MRFRLEATEAASTKAGIAETPALPGIEHPVSNITHSNDRHSNTPAFEPQRPITPAPPSIEYPVSSITLSKDHWADAASSAAIA